MIQTSRRCILSLIFVVVIYLLTAQPWKKTFSTNMSKDLKKRRPKHLLVVIVVVVVLRSNRMAGKIPPLPHTRTRTLPDSLTSCEHTNQAAFFIPFFLSICRVIRAWWMMKNISFKERLCLSYMHACTISFIIEIYCGLKNLFDFQLNTAIFCFC